MCSGGRTCSMTDQSWSYEARYLVRSMQVVRHAIQLSLVSAVTILGSCGPATRSVSFQITDTTTNAPVALARLRATPLSTNGVPLPLTLDHWRGASERLKVSRSADEHGLVTLRLSKGQPSVIEVLRWDLLAPITAQATGWIYDPRDRSLTRAGYAMRAGEAQQGVRLELAGR